MIGVEPEIIQRAPANRIRGLVLRKGFAVPSYRTGLSDLPRRAAIALAPWDVVVCPAGLLTRSVKPDVRDVYSGPERHGEGLNATIQVLVIERVFIVPNAT